ALPAMKIVATPTRTANLKYRMKNRLRLGTVVPCAQKLCIVVGDRGASFDMRPADRLIQCVDPAFNFEDFVAVRPLHRDEDVCRARSILLDHPRVGLQPGIAHVHLLAPDVVADSRGIDSASVQYDHVRRTAAAARRALRRARRDRSRYEKKQHQQAPLHLKSLPPEDRPAIPAQRSSPSTH